MVRPHGSMRQLNETNFWKLFMGFSIIVERILDIQNPTELYLLITQNFMIKLHLKQTRIFERELDLVLVKHAYHTPIYPTVLS